MDNDTLWKVLYAMKLPAFKKSMMRLESQQKDDMLLFFSDKSGGSKKQDFSLALINRLPEPNRTNLFEKALKCCLDVGYGYGVKRILKFYNKRKLVDIFKHHEKRILTDEEIVRTHNARTKILESVLAIYLEKPTSIKFSVFLKITKILDRDPKTEELEKILKAHVDKGTTEITKIAEMLLQKQKEI